MPELPYLTEIRNHLRRNELRAATDGLRALLDQTPLLTEALQLAGRHDALLARIRSGTVSTLDATLTENQIRMGLLGLVDEIEHRYADQQYLHAEIDRGVTIAAKNVFIGNTFQGPVNFNFGKELPRELTPNPFRVPDFLGRADELAELHNRLFSGDDFLLLVNGDGGVGKTSLASRYYCRYKDEYRHVAWVVSERNIALALLQLAGPLGVEFPDAMPNSQRMEHLLAALAQLPEPTLLVIDNANDPAQLRTNYAALRQCGNCHLLLTTRMREFDAPVRFFPVTGLPEAEAMQLFRTHYPGHRPAEDDLLRQFIRDVENNTLLVELFAKNLRRLNRLRDTYTLQQLLADIDRSLLALSHSQEVSVAYQARGTGLRRESPEAIVLAMYDVGTLTEAGCRLISRFAALPNEPVPYALLAALSGDDEDLEEPALSLAGQGWVEFNETDRTFKVNQVVQDVVRAKQRDRLLTDCRPLINNLAKALKDDELYTTEREQLGLLLVRYAQSFTPLHKRDVITSPPALSAGEGAAFV